MTTPRLFVPLAILMLLASHASAQNWGAGPVWSDEFSGTTINTANWEFMTGLNQVNEELEYYCAPTDTTNGCNTAKPNAYLDGNGHLIIQAIQVGTSTQPYSGSWTSARLDTAASANNFQYGRLESSMSLPTGPGLWPAFWALGTNINSVGWPTSGEMDFMENVPVLGVNVIKSTIHGGISSTNCYCGGNGLGLTYNFPGGTDVTLFHAYGAIWSANMVQFYVDDPSNTFFVRTASDVPAGQTWDFNHPFYLLLNLAVGGTGSWPGAPDSTTPNPAVMMVDYVRYYTAAPIAGPAMTAPAMSVTAGQNGSSTAALSSTAGNGRVYLSCTTNAPKATCAINSGDPLDQFTVDFSTANTGTAQVSVTTTANTAASVVPFKIFGGLGTALAGFVLVLPFAASGRRTRVQAVAGIAVLFSLALLASCGGSSSSSTGGGGGGGGTTPGSYTVTVNAYTVSNTTGNPDSTLSIPLTVN